MFFQTHKNNLGKTVLILSQQFGGNYLDPIKWENSIYKPTPTIIEAAQALYQGHSVKEISRSDSGAENLIRTADTINKIIEKSKKEKTKSICFITGVPGSGKTLAGLNLANERHKFSRRACYFFYLEMDP
jgi:replicative DNA helicase